MKLSEINSAPGFEDLLAFKDVEQEDKHNATMLMFKFLSEVEDVTKNNNIARKKLAELIGTSASNVTQLFRGNRLINLLTLAKLERVLDIEFEVNRAKKTEGKTENLDTINLFSINSGDTFSVLTSSFGDAYLDKAFEGGQKTMKYVPSAHQSFTEKV